MPDIAQPAMYTLGLASDPSTGVSTHPQPGHPGNMAAADCVIACNLPLGLHRGAAATLLLLPLPRTPQLKTSCKNTQAGSQSMRAINCGPGRQLMTYVQSNSGWMHPPAAMSA